MTKYYLNMSIESIVNIIAKGAPLLASALLGPAAGAVAGMIAGVFGGNSSDLKDLAKRISLDPESQVKLAQIQADNIIKLQQLEIERLKVESDERKTISDNESAERISQTEINKQDASSLDRYQARWRPTLGYICCLGLGWTLFIQPLFVFFAVLFGCTKSFPTTPMGDLMTLVAGMLGVGCMHSYDNKIINQEKNKR